MVVISLIIRNLSESQTDNVTWLNKKEMFSKNQENEVAMRCSHMFGNRPHLTEQGLAAINAGIEELKARNLKREIVIWSVLDLFFHAITTLILTIFTFYFCWNGWKW